MPIPAKGDPRRPLHIAIPIMRVLGGIFVLFGTCLIVPFGLRAGLPTSFGRSTWLALISIAFYLVPGTCFILFSMHLARRKLWAVVASICLASIALLIGVLALTALIILMLAPHADFEPAMLLPLTLVLLVVAALVQLIASLTKSFEAIRIAPPEARGFEPIMPGRVDDQ